jgi:hypothetical protein
LDGAEVVGLDLQGTGSAGQSCRLLVSFDLSEWSAMATSQFGQDGKVQFHNEGGVASGGRLYRLVVP